MRPSSRRAQAFVLALAVAGAAGCRLGADPAGSAASRHGVPGVVVVCVDTLRADSLTTDAESPGPLPALDAFARTGTVFSDAASNSSWTPLAVASLLTGLVPANSGVRRSGGLLLSPVVRTLAARLASEGWSTWGFSGGGMVAPEHGLSAGFEEFRTSFDDEGPEACIARWRRERRPDAPFFLFLHTYAAHDPYGEKVPDTSHSPDDPAIEGTARRLLAGPGEPTEEARLWLTERFLSDPSGRLAIQRALGHPRVQQTWQQTLAWLDGAGRGTPAVSAVGARLRTAYRAGLASADQVLARTFAALDAAGCPKETAIFVLGDHGEAFGEHGTLSHGRFLFDEVVRIPLVARVPGRWPEGAVVRGACSLVDVAPTVLSLAGLTPAPGLDGRSLEALLAGPGPDRPVVAEEERRSEDGSTWLRATSVRIRAAKYVRTVRLPDLAPEREEVYDLGADPGERSPLPVAQALRFGSAFRSVVEAARGGWTIGAEPGPR